MRSRGALLAALACHLICVATPDTVGTSSTLGVGVVDSSTARVDALGLTTESDVAATNIGVSVVQTVSAGVGVVGMTTEDVTEASTPIVATMQIKRSPLSTPSVRKSKAVKEEKSPRVNIVKDALFPVLEAMIVSPINEEVEDELCRNHSRIFQQELANFKLWAVQMVDAGSKLPSGILPGSVYQLGHFDECLGVSVQLPGPGQDKLRGQYCLAEVQFAPRNPRRPDAAAFWAQPDFNTSAWTKFKGEDRRLRRRDVLHWAVCIPASCSASSLRTSMQQQLRTLSDALDIELEVRVNPALCQVQQGWFHDLRTPDLVMIAIILLFVMMVGAGTVHDLMRPDNHPCRQSHGGKLLQCFSSVTSLRNWSRVDPSRDMIPLHVVRFGSMIGILMGHHFIADASSPLLNSEFLEQAADNIFCLPLLVIPALVVDSFFLVSGFLTTRFILLDLDSQKLKVFAGYMHRFLRLTPVYMLMVGFHATLLGKIGSGPLWPTRLARDRVRCSKNWWTNLLYINNYVNTDELCLFQSWHVACDLHFSLIAPVLVMCMWHRPRTGLGLIAFLGAATATALYAVTWAYDLDPILMSFINVMTDLSADATFRLQYIPTHTRGIPYLIGIVAAYLHYKYPISQKQLSQRMVLALWAATLVLMTSPMFAAVVFYSPHYTPASWMSPAYAALHRLPWCIGQAWVIVVGITGNAGFLQKALDFKLLVPLSRLSYCVFLVHNGVQLVMGASVRSPQYLGPGTILWMLLGDIVVTYAIALGVHLVFEAPIQRLDKTFFTKADNKSKSAVTLPTTEPGWKQNLAYEKGSDEIATIFRGTAVNSTAAVS